MKTANRLTSLNNTVSNSPSYPVTRPRVQSATPMQPTQSPVPIEPLIDTSNDCIVKIPMTLSPGQKFAILVQCEGCSKEFKKKDKCCKH
jgi:hypothetical protein